MKNDLRELEISELEEVNGAGWRGALIGAALIAATGPVGLAGAPAIGAGAVAGHFIEEAF